ncbi:uncharacterized protein LOC135481268 [Liolophura sinensis]|uniref:uncharacterized protein LOC135481268 n=1 Tax=Liolophura sinensis TaxID=3198878 RepID=UPI003158FBFA
MIFCLICVCAFKKKARRAKRSTAATISSIDSTLIKLPRPWMDTSRSYEAPPRDLRRWSYVSEPIRYADELMIDDHYHSETLPLPHSYDQTRRQMASYQNPVYHSETLPARPSYHMAKYRM